MNYKAGTKVEIVHLRGPKNYPSDFIGKQGIIIEICDHHGSFPFRIEVQGVLMADYLKWYAEDEFKVIPETPQFSVGSKVTVFDGSYDCEFIDGKVIQPPCGEINKGVHEIIEMDKVLPASDQNIYKDTLHFNDTIIRRISDSKVFFVQSRFLREYVVVPKFKRGQIVECNKCYCRIAKVNDDLTYVITTNTDVYNRGAAYAIANEGELKEVQ